MGFIYKITNPNGRMYVGKTHNIRKRINAHKCIPKKRKNRIILNSIIKYGWDKHSFEIIEEVPDDRMNEREIFWISELKTYCYDYPGQMNMTKGGEGQRSSWMHDTERRRIASENSKGEKNNFFGKRHSEDFKKWMSEFSRDRNKKEGRSIPEWGVQKGRNIVRRPVLGYDINGFLIAEYMSLTDAKDKLNINISSVKDSLKLDTWVAGKYFFRYKEGKIKQKIDVPPVTLKTIKRPIYWLSEDLEIITEFP